MLYNYVQVEQVVAHPLQISNAAGVEDGATLGLARVVPQQPELVEDEGNIGRVEEVHGGIRLLIPTAFHPSRSTVGA
jgi:hypothetical protein